MAGFSAKKQELTPEMILSGVQAGQIKPVYYLMGEESYYIDFLADEIVNQVLRPEEKSFNLITFFGYDANVTAVQIADAARAYPLGSTRQVVLVKEAQGLKSLEAIEQYLKQPQPQTVLIFCHKNGKIDRRKSVAALISKIGVLYESAKLRDYQLAPFIRNYVQRKGFTINNDALEMLAQYVGADLHRLASEIDKLTIALPEGEKTILKDLVAENIGVSKEYNIFEFQDALVSKNAEKAFAIAHYFEKTPKDNPIQKVLANLFSFFSTLMIAYYVPGRTEAAIAETLHLDAWRVRKNIMPALSLYKPMHVMNILSAIRRMDARSKGVQASSSTSSGDLLKELLAFIFVE